MNKPSSLGITAVVAILMAANAGVAVRGGGAANPVVVEAVRTIPEFRVFHEGADDKAGFWEDFGNTAAFDFNMATNRLVAVNKKVDGPPRLFVFDLTTGEVKARPLIAKTSQMAIAAVRLSPDGTIAAVPMGRSKKFSLWNVETATQIAEAAVDGEAGAIDWHPSGTSLAVIADKRIELWTFKGGTLTLERRLNGSRDAREFPTTVRWSPDGGYIAIGTNWPSVYVGKPNNNQSPNIMPGLTGRVTHLEWSPSGDRIVAAANDITTWSNPKSAVDTPFEKTYALLHKVTPAAGHTLRTLASDPLGQYVMFGEEKTNAAIWDAASGVKLAPFTAHQDAPMTEAHWKGEFLITAGGYPNRGFRIWKVTATP